MSAIVGILRRDQRPVERRELEAMLTAIRWRGPDGLNVWWQGPVGLGHALLRVTSESCHDRQPLLLGDLAIAADARLDNRSELGSALGLAGSLDDMTDTELVLRTYARWGERCVEHLLGDFAFAVWDGRLNQLFCARDHFGVRPFVYYLSNQVFLFGTQAAAPLATGEVTRRVNEAYVARYITAQFDAPALTAYSDLRRLPAAHSLTVTAHGSKIERYWTIDPKREIRLRCDAEYEEAFREVFLAAVECRLRAAFPVGSTLSGGLDSSSIACTAGRMLSERGPLPTFSLRFPRHPSADESAFIASAQRYGGFDSHLIDGDAICPFVDLDRQLEAQSEPAYAPNLFLHWEMYRSAHEAGIRVLLDGFDGDTTVSHGVQRLTELFWQGRLVTSWREARALRERYGGNPWRKTVARQLRLAARSSLKTLDSLFPVSPLVCANEVSLSPHLISTLSPPTVPRPTRSERQVHRDFLLRPLFDMALEVVDRAAAAHGLECRFPFFDRRLAEFCVALPAGQKLRHGWTRSILRRSMVGILPPAIQWRVDKSDLSPILTTALLAYERNRVYDAVRSVVIEPYVDRTSLLARWEQYQTAPTALDAVILWRWTSLALWLEYEDRQSRSQLRWPGPAQVKAIPTGNDRREARL